MKKLTTDISVFGTGRANHCNDDSGHIGDSLDGYDGYIFRFFTHSFYSRIKMPSIKSVVVN